ncbi:TPA: YopX family protein [Listeria monocytogenes]
MRGIEFRGKIVGVEGFVYGKLLAPLASGNAYIAYDVNEVRSFVYISRSEKVDPETVGQYTGLKDKYGKKIFEGDICWEEHNECYGVVKFEDAKFLYLWENIAEDLWEVADSIEIYGNIHENPELLEA